MHGHLHVPEVSQSRAAQLCCEGGAGAAVSDDDLQNAGGPGNRKHASPQPRPAAMTPTQLRMFGHVCCWRCA
jgi:hypothetical protein